MNHAMTVGAQDGKVLGNVVVHGDALFERTDWLQVMRFNKALTNRAIAFAKIKIAGMADGAWAILL